jgi:hypothetical protein
MTCREAAIGRAEANLWLYGYKISRGGVRICRARTNRKGIGIARHNDELLILVADTPAIIQPPNTVLGILD